MTLDLIKIGHIKTKAMLKKYSLNKPLMNGNYLFHYLILTNNLKGLKLYNHKIFKFNNDGLNGLMLAAKEKKYDILNYFLEKYKNKKFIYAALDEKLMTFLYYMSPTDPEYNMIINNHDLYWKSLFIFTTPNNICPLDLLFSNGKYNTIKNIINKIDFNYKSYISQPYHFNLLFNNNLKDNKIEKILDLLEEKDNKILEYTDETGYDISHGIVLNENMDLLKYIIKKRGEKLDRYTAITANHIFIIAYKEGVKTNDYKMAEYILENVMNNHNYDETDMYGNNLVHFILKIRLMKKGNYAIENKILSKYKHWGRINMDKKTPFDFIINLDYKKYHKFLTNKPNNININNNIDKKWLKYIKDLPIDVNDDNVRMINSPYAHSNMFQAKFTDIGIFSIYLNEKYNKNKGKNNGTLNGTLYMPIYYGDDVTPEWNDDMALPDNMLKFYNNYPWIIIWNDDNNYWIHPKLISLINKNKTNYDASFVFISLRVPNGGLHAALIFFDFNTNQIQRFDPYGDTTNIDGQMDEILEEKLAKPTNMKYCGPDCYFPVSGFQTLSDENNDMNQKMGDFGGYCLAWSIWYVEHKMINLKVNPKDLIRKTLNRFMSMNIKPMEYIRNYANYISKFRIEYLKKIGIPENITTNVYLSNMYVKIIIKSIIEYEYK